MNSPVIALSRLSAAAATPRSLTLARNLSMSAPYRERKSFEEDRAYADDPDKGRFRIKTLENMRIPNQVGIFEHYRLPQPLIDDEYNYPVCIDTMGIKWPGYWFQRKFVYVKEMEPELVVPDLEDFPLKPYVSYRADEVDNDPFTAKDLFDAVYADQVGDDFQVTQEEIDEARLKAMQTGADLFEDYNIDGVRAPMDWVVD